MDPLALLTQLLRQANGHSGVAMRPCTEIDKVHADLELRVRTGSTPNEPRDLQVEAVTKFWDTHEFESLRQARLVSFGLTVRPRNDRRCLMEEPDRFGAVLAGLAQWEHSPRQFRKCYQGLVRSYFDYDGLGRDTPPVGQRTWLRLQAHLGQKANLIQDVKVNPDWVHGVLENLALFSRTPCDAYAQDLLDGREERVKRLRALLGITDASWFTRELVLSQIARACDLDHAAFSALVSRLLSVLGGNEVLRDRGLQMLLNRYAQMPQPPQHGGLKDTSIAAWGNPWLPSNEHRWGGVSAAAQQMVGNWLKLEFIELFFTKLAQEGLSDTRRLNFWAKYVPLIENIHFALGTYATQSAERDYVELRRRLHGLTVNLEDSNSFNNAFIMTIGDLVAVEFSGASNAFYGYSVKRSLPFDLSKPVRSAPVNGRNSLKNRACVLYLRHQDNVHGHEDWEDRFSEELRTKFGLVAGSKPVRRAVETAPPLARTPSPPTAHAPSPPPAADDSLHWLEWEALNLPAREPRQEKRPPQREDAQRPATAPTPATGAQAKPTNRRPLPTPASEIYSEENLEQLARRFGASVVDHRKRGGALWVLMSDSPEARRILTSWGFEYRQGRGWWKESV